MILWLCIFAIVGVWLLKQLPTHRVQNAAWLRAARDSAILVEGCSQALHGLASLVLSLSHAVLLSLSSGALWLHRALQAVGRHRSTPKPYGGLEQPPAGEEWALWRKP